MSDNRRRRKSQQSGGSDDLSESYDELNATKETQSSEHTEGRHDSEYDTADTDSDTESQDRNQQESGDGQEEEKVPKKLECDEDRRNPQYIPKRGTFYEHDVRTADEMNDEAVETQPERETKDKKVWKDKEDRWDHDRYNDEEQAPKSHAELIAIYGYDIRNEEGPPRARRRRRYGRGPNKYTRNWEDEDAYGKVTGSVPLHKTNIKKSNRTGEEFPLLNPKDNDISSVVEEEPVITSAWYSNKNKIHINKTQNFPPLQQTDAIKIKPKQFTNSQVNENKAPNDRNNVAWKKDSKHIPYTNETVVSSGDTEKIVIVKTTPRDNKKSPQVHETVNFVSNKSRGRGFKANTNNNIVGSRTIESKSKGRGSGLINMDNRRNNIEHEQIISDLKHMNVSTEGPSYHHATRPNKHFYTQPSSQQHSTVVPPRMQSNHAQQQPPPQQQSLQQPPQQDISTNRPKRYSSLRQRPTIAEGPANPGQPNYQPAPQHTYYPPPQAGSSRAVLESSGYPSSPYEQSAPVSAAGSAMSGQPVISIPPGAQPSNYSPHAPHAPHATHTSHTSHATHAPHAPHAPPPFLVPPPQFIPSQTAPPNIINYVTGPNGPIFQPNFQGYNPAAVQPGPPPPQDVGLYQPQGCTYYSPAQQQQQQQQQSVPLRRPKAAIPILPPPDNSQNQNNRGKNRSIQQQSQAVQEQQLQQEQLMQQQIQQDQLMQQQMQQEQSIQHQLQEQLMHQQHLDQEQLMQRELHQEQCIPEQEPEQKQSISHEELQQQQYLTELPQQQDQKLIVHSQEVQEQNLIEHPQVDKQLQQQQHPVEEPEQEEDQVIVNSEQKQSDQDQRLIEYQPLIEQQQQQQQQKKQQQSIKSEEEQIQDQQPENNANSKITVQPVEEIISETVCNIDQVVQEDTNVSTNKLSESKILSTSNKEKFIVSIKKEPLETVFTEAEAEQKETITKVEVVFPDIVADVEEKTISLTTIASVTDLAKTVTTVSEEATTDASLKCIVEGTAIITSEDVNELSTKSVQLLSGKNETDCSIKESAVIEEAAA